MIGSPPGYVGHEEGGQLTEAIRRKPYSVILFDEIEKAHPDVAQILLQILEDGRLTDSLGRKVDFRNTILIMTSNVGAHILQRNSSLGFSTGNSEDDFDNTKDKIMDEAKKSFKPEFLNRLTEIVIFRPLVKDSMRAIVDLELKKVTDRLKEKKLKLLVSDQVKEFLIEKGYDNKLGARPLRRAVEKYLEDSLAEEVLSGSLRKNKTIHVLITEDEDPKLYFSQDDVNDKVPITTTEDKDKEKDS
jgi:ATP-dependent Clp protease ATP-binding subunit ClpC